MNFARFSLNDSMFILDTNVISELKKRTPNQGVMSFFANLQINHQTFFISSITKGELLAGVHKLYARQDIIQARLYEKWVTEFFGKNTVNVLDFDEQCAEIWGKLISQNPQNPIDKQIGATALVYDLTLVTRNVKHFADTPVALLNPFT